MVDAIRLKKLRSVFIVNFMLTIGIALTSYIDSSFVETFVKKESIGLLFALASSCSLVYVIFSPRILERLGLLNSLRLFGCTYMLAIVGLVTVHNPSLLFLIFTVYWVSGMAMYLNIDVLLEHYSERKTTGKTRGFYLAIYNFAFLIAPFVAGILVDATSLRGVYLLAGGVVGAMMYFFIHQFKDVHLFPKQHPKKFFQSLADLFQNKNLRHIYLITLTLHFFFAWMTVYTPIYLHDSIGFSWQEIGAIFAIMHIPYVLLETTWGNIADKILGEKEILSAGLTIMGLCTIAISFISSTEFWVWAMALLLTRIGASMVQVGTETYFFKKIKEEDTDKISIFRNASPVAFLVGPLIATVAFFLASFSELFIILGVIVLCALIPTHRLNDTK